MANPPTSDANFYKEMIQEDALGLVLRAAIHVEGKIIDLLEKGVDAKSLKEMQMTYEQRVSLAIGLGLAERLKSPLVALGRIRNKFAHTLDAALSESEVKNFYESFAPTDKEIIQSNYAKLRKQWRDQGKRKSAFRALPPQDRFAICVVTLRAALTVANKQAKHLD